MRIQLYSDTDSFPGVPSDLEFQPYLDTFLVDSVKNPLGAVLIFPGGGYNHRAFHEGDPIAQRFTPLSCSTGFSHPPLLRHSWMQHAQSKSSAPTRKNGALHPIKSPFADFLQEVILPPAPA